MKLTFNYLLLLLLFIAGTGCNNNSDSKSKSDADASSEIIAGDNQKTWKASKETDATGDKDRLTRDEKRESITFYRNGNMSMGGPDALRQGTWKYEGSTLSIQFVGEGVSENFTVLDLSDKEMKLRAADGSEMIMKPD